MWQNSLTIQNPYGVSVFGSAVLRISPDSATIHAAVSCAEEKPAPAFSKAKESARSVAEFLRKANLREFGASRVSLSQERRFVGGEMRFVGYRATVGFTIVLRSLDQFEEVVTGAIEAGANQITSIEFQTSRLKELRTQARQKAMEAAREKAFVYAQAAGVPLGKVIHIEDVNPKILERQLLSHLHSVARGQSGAQREDFDEGQPSLDPGEIEVGAGVLVAFSLERDA